MNSEVLSSTSQTILLLNLFILTIFFYKSFFQKSFYSFYTKFFFNLAKILEEMLFWKRQNASKWCLVLLFEGNTKNFREKDEKYFYILTTWNIKKLNIKKLKKTATYFKGKLWREISKGTTISQRVWEFEKTEPRRNFFVKISFFDKISDKFLDISTILKAFFATSGPFLNGKNSKSLHKKCLNENKIRNNVLIERFHFVASFFLVFRVT